jgi:arylsulfatase A-like enzyme
MICAAISAGDDSGGGGRVRYRPTVNARPNVLLLITDQQRAPRHWPDDSTWLRELMPADHELARTGLSFRRAFAASCMCTPSRATLLTGRWPSDHGLTLTLTAEGAKPHARYLPGVLSQAPAVRRAGIPPQRGMVNFVRLVTGIGAGRGVEPELSPATPNLARMLERAGYHVGYRGKWHLTKPVGEGWSEADGRRIEEEFGFRGWVPPDAGEDVEPEHFGGGSLAGTDGRGWDEDFTRQAESFLTQPSLPEPFALVVSLVNPHDVLAYPSTYRRGGYERETFRELGVGLPATYDEDLRDKPSAHGLMSAGQAAILGPIGSRAAALDYVNFYAYLHAEVDRKLQRIVAALGDPGDPGSLRSRTLVVRCSDHGEMGLAHGGLRQKMFNAYEETIAVPLVVSNPVLFPQARETDALASLVDVLPTLATACGADASELGLRGADLAPVLARHCAPDPEALSRAGAGLERIAGHSAPADAVQDAVRFTYDDHQAGTARADVVPQPNRVRCVREAGWKYAIYVDATGRRAAEHELYDLERDPLERRNLVDRTTGAPREPAAREHRDSLRERLRAQRLVSGA